MKYHTAKTAYMERREVATRDVSEVREQKHTHTYCSSGTLISALETMINNMLFQIVKLCYK